MPTSSKTNIEERFKAWSLWLYLYDVSGPTLVCVESRKLLFSAQPPVLEKNYKAECHESSTALEYDQRMKALYLTFFKTARQNANLGSRPWDFSAKTPQVSLLVTEIHLTDSISSLSAV